MKRALAVVLLCLVMDGCAGIGVWSPAALQTLTKYVAWANQWIGGALKSAPAILAEAETLLGANNRAVKDAQGALDAATGALDALNKVAQTGESTNTQEANVQTAIGAINETVGAVKTAIAQAQAVPAPAK